MAEVSIVINKKTYVVGCADGQEARVLELARLFNDHVDMVLADVGTIGEVRLFLMAGLLMSDEMQELKSQLLEAKSNQSRAQAQAQELERRAGLALSDAAFRVEKLVDSL
jgi:cell division protein ZapA